MFRKCLVAMSLLTVLLAGQAGTVEGADQQLDFSQVTYIQSETERNLKLETALKELFDVQDGGSIRYFYNRIDLNNDQIPEIFAFVTGPFVCGTGGCSAAIFQEADNKYKLVSRFSLVRNPILISDKETNGWRDIIMLFQAGVLRERIGNLYSMEKRIHPIHLFSQK
ncbi:hypothetical protein [Bacillus sp. Marseille-Q1617]|uniref:hypothetical protein n=1 Tax=Bacillus sp. Marseille-Q1617 TaxID=2736887 RepID=UPI00158837C9|nr:hypothetical protein [Bacillus sp. Marseille-Q1617]